MTLIETAEHLKTLLTTEEQREFMDTLLDAAGDLEGDVFAIKKQNEELEEQIGKIEDQLEEFEDIRDYQDEIDAGIGTIAYTAENFELSQLMETLAEKLDKNTPNRIVEYLLFLP